LESSKSWAKELMLTCGIPTPEGVPFSDLNLALIYARKIGEPLVVKANGLAQGKGVQICRTRAETEEFLHALLRRRALGESGSTVVIEEFVDGWEFSLMFFTDGKSYRLMPFSQDHKPVFDGDCGPNTGGMGAYTHVGTISQQIAESCRHRVIEPLLIGLQKLGIDFRGVVCANLIVGPVGINFLEFNARFGDPEAPLILPLLESDIIDIAEATIDGRLDGQTIVWDDRAALCVSMAAAGYPGVPQMGNVISGLDTEIDGSFVFHAATKRTDDGVVTAGGRVLTVTGVGGTLLEARRNAYDRVELIHFDGVHFRTDIGWRTLGARVP
jgi:phosphoribosylamine--glycine ligase